MENVNSATKYNVQIGQKSFQMSPTEGFTITNFLTVADIDRSAKFYETVFGGHILNPGDRDGAPAYIQLANTWLILNVGGGPTTDKPNVILSVLADPNKISSFLNIRVADIHACYELWASRGQNFLPRRSSRTERFAATSATLTAILLK